MTPNEQLEFNKRFAMQEVIDGGPAFPYRVGGAHWSGMTMLDYIAIHATQQDINPYIDAAPMATHIIDDGLGNKREVVRKVVIPNHVARYAFAQAMLEQSRRVRS